MALSLTEARKTGRLAEFIAEQEARSIGSANKRHFDALIVEAATVQTPLDQTSGSHARGDSTGKKIPLDTVACASRSRECG